MCGLVGMAGNLNSQTNLMMRDLMIFSTTRGSHSSGLGGMKLSEKTPFLLKAVGSPFNLFYQEEKSFSPRGTLTDLPKVLIGHTRFATQGDITADNAHPFLIENILGAHNGHLYNTTDLVDDGVDALDSRKLFKTIAKYGIKEAWKKVAGAAALTFWDNETETINLVRNSERPLWIATTPNEDAIFWASESWMLTAAASRNNITLKKSKGEIELWQPEAHALHSWKPTSMTCPLDKVTTLEKKPFPRAITTTTHGGYDSNKRNFWVKPNNTVSSFTKFKTKMINKGWATGLPKADKSIVGKPFRLSYTMDTDYVLAGGKLPFHVIVGITPTGERVRVFPSTMAAYKEWENRLEMNPTTYNRSLAVVECRFLTRPRIKEVTNYKKETSIEYHIEDSGVITEFCEDWGKVKTTPDQKLLPKSTETEEKFYRFRDSFVSAKTWNELMKTFSSKTCAWCGNPLLIEDANTLVWLNGKDCLCADCASDSAIRSEIKQLLN